MKTVCCDRVIHHSDGIIEVRYSEDGREAGALTFRGEAAFIDWLERTEKSLSAEQLLALAILPAYRAKRSIEGCVAAIDNGVITV